MDNTNVYALSICGELLPRLLSNSEASLTARPARGDLGYRSTYG
ncbi:hypothetical protein [Ruminococcus albus]|nr:hypothetical protein [Ruminococcus albus]